MILSTEARRKRGQNVTFPIDYNIIAAHKSLIECFQTN